MPRVCSTDHAGGAVPKKLDDLPESQAGALRHKCVACAYEMGVKDGLASAERLRERVRELEEKLRGLTSGGK